MTAPTGVQLRDAHRVLSEQIVAANRKLPRVAKLDNLDSPEVRAVRERLATLQAQRAGLDAPSNPVR